MQKGVSKRNQRLRLVSILSLVLILGTVILIAVMQSKTNGKSMEASAAMDELKQGKIVDSLLHPNKYSRPQLPLKKVKGIVVHYTANPGTDADANRNYFDNLPKINKQKGTKVYASSNFIIGIDGKILRVVPETEMAYASNERNKDTLSIECCYLSKNGSFTKETRKSLVWLISTLCQAYNLDTSDVIRHYDVTGKNCPKYYVEHEDAWLKLKEKIQKEIEK